VLGAHLPPSATPFYGPAWLYTLRNYPGDLGRTLYGILTYGAQIGIQHDVQHSIYPNQASVQLAPQFLSDKVAEDLSLQRIQPAIPTNLVSSPLGLVVKHDGGWRRIHNLSHPIGRSVNDAIPEESAALVYTTIDNVLHHVREVGRGCILVKRDIKDAFRNIPVAVNLRRLLAFEWQGHFYTESCLPFGLRTAPILFNLFAEGLHWVLQSQIPTTRMEHYLDDFIFVLPSSPSILLSTSLLYDEITDILGVPRNESKNVEGTTAEILGIEIDTIRMEARLSARKQAQAIEEIQLVLQHQSTTLETARRLAGRLSWCSKVITLARSFTQPLWRFIASFSAPYRGQSRRRMPQTLVEDLSWWITALRLSNGVLFFEDGKRAQIHLFTDASGNLGLGAFWYRGLSSNWRDYEIPLAQAFSLAHGPSHSGDHINVKEVTAIERAFSIWAHHWTHSTVCIHTDSTVALAGLRRHYLNGPSNVPLRQLLLQAAAYDITLTTAWLASKENALADALSRLDGSKVATLCPYWVFTAFNGALGLLPRTEHRT